MKQEKLFSPEKTYSYSKRRKQVLQNNPESFRPTNEVKQFLKDIQEVKGPTFNKSQEINNAIILVKQSRVDPFKLLDEMSLKYPLLWRRVNRKNGQFIKQKIQEIK